MFVLFVELNQTPKMERPVCFRNKFKNRSGERASGAPEALTQKGYRRIKFKKVGDVGLLI